MARSKDLDTVAPDDQVEVITDKNPPPTPSLEEMRGKTKKISKKSARGLKDASENINTKIYDIVGYTKHPFSSLLVNPTVFDFEERDVEEKIILVARPHWFTNVSWIITAIFLVMAPSLLKFVPIFSDLPTKYQIIGMMTWYMVTFAFSFEKFLSWYFDVFIITDERVIDIDFNNMLDKKFSEAKISMIQDITSRVSGVSQTLFNYGTVFVQTAAEVPEITFEKVPNPEKIIKVLQILRTEEEQEALEGRVR